MPRTKTTKPIESTSASRSRSRSRSQRPNYKIDDVGLNKTDEDEEYKEEEEEEEKEEEEEEEESLPRRRSKRTRNKIKEEEKEEEEQEELEGENQVNDDNTILEETTEDIGNVSGVETPKNKTNVEEINDQNTENLHVNKKMKLSYPVDANGNPLPVVNDEYALPDDPSGDEKIDLDGNLKGGRKFKVRTFKLFNNGDRLFMLATEPARAVGLRDSNVLFQNHPNLYKYILSQTEKNKLISQGVLPYSYRNRTISVVAARSIFKEFGHQIIINGKENDDDYYSDPKLRHNIVKEGQVPKEKQSHRGRKSKNAKNRHGKTSHNNTTTTITNKHRHTEKQDYIDQAQLQSSTDPAKNTVEFFQNNQSHSGNTSHVNSITNMASTNVIHATNNGMNMNHNYGSLFNINGSQLNATNWLYQHAAACSRYNSDIYYDRVRILLIENQGIRDPYTNTLHIPQGTQPTRVIRYQKVNNLKDNDISDNKEVQYEVIMEDKDLLRPITGLNKIPKEIYEDVVDKDTLKAIEEQKTFEMDS